MHTVTVQTTFTGPQPPRVRLRYAVAHAQAAPARAQVRYSTDGAATWRAATPRPDLGSEPTDGLSTTPSGELHLFVWDAPADLGGTEHSGLRLQVEVGPAPGGIAETPPFNTTAFLPPSVRITAVLANRHLPTVDLDYVLLDEANDLCRVRVRWSADGVMWHPASEAPGAGSHGVAGLRTSLLGVPHRFVWDAAGDLPQPQARRLLLGIEALDTQLGGTETSLPFDFGVNTPPTIELLGSPAVAGGGRVLVPFVVRDPDGDPCSLTVSFRSPAAPLPRPATAAMLPWASGTAGIASSPGGQTGVFVWDSGADVVAGSAESLGVVLRFAAADGDPGNAVETAPVDVVGAGGARVIVRYPDRGTWPAAVPIHVVVVDGASAPIDLVASWSLDGQQWNPVTPTPGAGLTSLTGLATSPDGREHVLTWDAKADLGLPETAGVLLRVQETGAPPGDAVTVGPLRVLANEEVRAEVVFPTPGAYSGRIAIRYRLVDLESDTCGVEVQYSADGGTTWRGATPTADALHEGQARLSSSFLGDEHVYVWDAPLDLGATGMPGVLVRIQPADVRPGISGLSRPFDVVASATPTVRLLCPDGAAVGNPVPVLYELQDTGTLPLDVAVEWSAAGGGFRLATEAPGVGSEGVVALAASGAGVRHFFAWDAVRDLGAGAATGVVLRLTATNAVGSTAVTSPSFGILAGFIGVPALRPGLPAPPRPPDILLMGTRLHPTTAGPQQVTGRHVPVAFRVRHPDGQRVNVLVRFRVQGGPWRAPTPAPLSDHMTNLAAPPAGADYRFVWDAFRDLGETTTTAEIEATPYVGAVEGNTDQTHPIRLTLRAEPALPVADPVPDLSTATLAITGGDGQYGVAGQLLRDALQVVVRAPDPAGGEPRPLGGVRVRFEVVPPHDADVVLVDDTELGTTTADDGRAGVRVRVLPRTSPVAFRVKAILADLPGPEQLFAATAAPLVIHPFDVPAGPLEYGRVEHFRLRLIHPGRPTENDLRTAPAHPVLVRLEATGVQLDRDEVVLDRGDTSQVHFRLVPTILDSGVAGAIRVRASIPAAPSQPAWEESYAVATPSNARTWTGPVNQPPSQTRDVRLRFRLAVPQAMPQRAWEGALLDEGFRVEIVDDLQPQPYAQVLGPNDPYQGLATLNPQPLRVQWSGTGEFRTSRDPAALTVNEAAIGQTVHFTPAGPGPWLIEASFSGNVYDPNAPTFAWVVTPGGPVQRTRQNGMTATLRLAVPIAGPRRIALEDLGRPGLPVDEVRTNRPYRVLVSGLSPYVVTPSLARPAVESRYLERQRYAGYPHAFRERLVLSAAGPDALESEPLTLLQGHPDPVPAGKVLATIPGDTVLLETPVRLLPVPVARCRRTRPAASRQENLAGTTPLVGLMETVNARSGEFLFHVTDLERPSRFEPLAVERTYRSHLVDEPGLPSPLGPGWTLSFDQHLSFRLRGRELRDGAGRVDPFDHAPPPGAFVGWRQNLTITARASAWEQVVADHDTLHFDVDGALSALEDHRGGRVRLVRDAGGRLVRVEDLMAPAARRLTFRYHEEGTAPHDEWIGRLREIADWTGAAVTYRYYAPGEAGGAPGMLRQVEYPAAPTWDGTAVVDLARTETYEYVQEGGLWLLQRIRDGLGRIVVESTFAATRVVRQKSDAATGEVVLEYDAAGNAATVTSRTGAKHRYVFPVSPTPQGAAPTAVDEEVAGSWRTTAYTHDHVGRRTRQEDPDGLTATYVWQLASAVDQRSAGNLRVVRVVRPNAPERIWSYTYDPWFNRITSQVGAAGQAAGADPALHTVSYLYDGTYDPTRGDVGPGGNLLRILRPRSLHLAAYDAGDPLRPFLWRWLWEYPITECLYNDHGLLNQLQNAQGVVTRFSYYPEANWNGQGGQPPDPGHGGFLAAVEEDVEDTPARERHLLGAPRAPRLTRFTYDARGHLASTTDWRGVVTEVEVDVLGTLRRVVAAARSGGLGGGRIERVYAHDRAGQLVRAEILREGAPSAGSSPFLVLAAPSDSEGLVRVATLTPDQGPALQWSYDRDQAGVVRTFRPPLAADAPDAEVTVDWNPAGREVQVHDGRSGPGRRTTKLTYGADDELEQIEEPGQRKTNFHEDRAAGKEAAVDPEGNVTEVTRANDGDLVRVVEYDGRAGGNPGRTYPPQNPRVTQFEEVRLDEYERPTRSYVGLHPPETAAAPAGGRPIGRLPEDHAPTVADWPPLGTSDLEGGAFVGGDPRLAGSVQVDVFGQPTCVMDGEGGFTLIRRDAFGRVIQTFRSWGGTWGDVTNVHFDARGASVSTEDLALRPGPGGALQRVSLWARADLDAHERVYRFLDGAGRARYLDHDEHGHVTAVALGSEATQVDTWAGHPVYARGTETVLARDAFGRATAAEIAIPNNPFVPTGIARHGFRYKPGGLLEAIVDARGEETVYRYHDDARLREVERPVSSAGGTPSAATRTTYTWTPDQGLPETVVDPRAVTLRFDYDGIRLRRLEASQPLPVPGVPDGYEIGYDGNDAVTDVADINTGDRVTLVRDSVGLVRKETQRHRGGLPGLAFLSELVVDLVPELDGNGRRGRLTIGAPVSRTIGFARDLLGRLAELEIDGRRVATLEYVHGERRRQLELGDIAVVEFLDAGGFLGRLEVRNLQGGPLVWERRPSRIGRCDRQVRRWDGREDVREWDRDEAHRIRQERHQPHGHGGLLTLTTARWLDGDDVLRQKVVTRFDAGGPTPIPVVLETVDQEREERGRITTRNGARLAYDGAGGLVDDGRQRYVYDGFHRLIEVRAGGQTVATYAYDGLQRLIRRMAGGVTERYVHDGEDLVAVVVGTQVTESFAWGTRAGELWEFTSGPTRYRALRSPTGSVAALVDDQRRVVEWYDYDVDGRRSVLDDQWRPTTAAARCRFGFQGHMHDAATGLVWFGRRWYAPHLGQFLTPDPQGRGAGPNEYGLCRGDPVTWMDARGTDIGDAALGTVKFVGGFVWGLIEGAIVEPAKTVYDVDMTYVEIFGTVTGLYRYRHRNVSGAGQLAERVARGRGLAGTYGAFLWEMGAGVVGTPGRILDAARRGDWFEVGREASVFAPVAKGSVRIAGNAIIRRLPRQRRTQIRQFQAERMLHGWELRAGRYRLKIFPGELDRGLIGIHREALQRADGRVLSIRYRPGNRSVRRGGGHAHYDHRTHEIVVSESIFRQGFFSGRLPTLRRGNISERRLAAFEPPGGRGSARPRFHWTDRAAWGVLLRGWHAAGSVFHEVWHAVQHGRWDDFWDLGYETRAAGYFSDVREITQPGQVIPGAYDAQFRYGPMHPTQVEVLATTALAWLHAPDD